MQELPSLSFYACPHQHYSPLLKLAEFDDSIDETASEKLHQNCSKNILIVYLMSIDTV